MSTLVFLLEEESAKNLLIPVVERLIPEEIPVKYITFNLGVLLDAIRHQARLLQNASSLSD